MVMNDVMGCTAGVATGSYHPDYPGHWVTFCPGQSGFHPDILICLTRIKLNCLVIVRIKNVAKRSILSLIEQSLIFQGCYFKSSKAKYFQ